MLASDLVYTGDSNLVVANCANNAGNKGAVPILVLHISICCPKNKACPIDVIYDLCAPHFWLWLTLSASSRHCAVKTHIWTAPAQNMPRPAFQVLNGALRSQAYL